MKHLRTLALITAVGALIGGAAPALAAPGGNAKKTATTTTGSSIWITSVDGWSTGARTADASTTPTLRHGSTVTFGTTVEPLAGWEYAMVVVACFQDVDGNGVVDTSFTGPDVVQTSLQRPTETFELGGNSIWTQRGGGAALCRADLDAYGFKGGKQSIRVLGTLPLTVTG